MRNEKLVASPLPDQIHRDLASGQDPDKAALGKNIFIEAGAGTGKTETIVRRIINQLYEYQDLQMSQVAAITFTEKAAAELRNRFRKMLTKDLSDPKFVSKDRTKQLLENLDAASIGTIHAFAKQILSEHAVAASIPVGFRISNENSSEGLRTTRARKVVGQAFHSLSETDKSVFNDIEFTSKEMLEMVSLMDQKFTRMVGGYVIPTESNTEPHQVAGINFINSCVELLKDELENRRKTGNIEFDDLLVLTLRLLNSDRQVRTLIHNAVQIMVVDEFQDTDPLQWEIIKLITSSPDSTSNEPLKGRLVVVGDPKQAIYAFRGGDINTYLAAREQFPKFGEQLQLTSNFRSVKGVLDFVNDAFADRAERNPLNMGVSYEALSFIHDPEHQENGPAVLLLKAPAEADGDSKFDWTSNEMSQTAAAIRKAIDEKWQVTEIGREFGHQRVYKREANFGDICVLLPVRTHLKTLLKAFEAAKVPYRSTDPSIVYNRPLISGIRDAISVIAKSDDMTKLWGALKSPLFGFSDQALLEHRQSGGKWYPDTKHKGGIAEINDAMRLLAELSEKNQASNPAWLIEELLDRQKVRQVLLRDTAGQFEASCIRMVVAHAQQWLSEGNIGLLSYLDWVNTMLSESTRAALPDSDDLDSNAVQIMTIHASKGLEFPIAVVTGLASTMKAERPKLLFRPAANGEDQLVEFYLVVKDKNKKTHYESSGYSEFKGGAYFESVMQEISRLLYVATTRAKDHLILSVVAQPQSKDELKSGKPSSTPPRGRRLRLASVNFGKTYKNLQPYTPKHRDHDYKPELMSAENIDLDRAEKIRKESSEKVMRSPSSQEQEQRYIPVDRVEVNRNGTAPDGRPLGRAVHGIMELVMLSKNIPVAEEVDRFVDQIVEQEQAEDQSEEVRTRIHRLLENQEILEALGTSDKWPELQLALKVDEGSIRFVEGFADLVYKTREGYVLVDYKTDVSLEGSMDHYREQLGAYAEVIEQITGEKLARVLLIHARTDLAETVELKY